jgi:hypothetical protein
MDSGTADLHSQDANDHQLPLADKGSPRRWFSTSSKERPKKGLNPDAKVFNITRKTAHPALGTSGHISQASFDALNPNGLISAHPSMSSSDGTNFLRAFAPSPAEREVLQRALGGSTNASLERLPSLSDVGSIPSSPSHIHAHAITHDNQHQARDAAKVIPSWLQTLPRIRKPNFSPWDDEEPSTKTDFGRR